MNNVVMSMIEPLLERLGRHVAICENVFRVIKTTEGHEEKVAGLQAIIDSQISVYKRNGSLRRSDLNLIRVLLEQLPSPEALSDRLAKGQEIISATQFSEPMARIVASLSYEAPLATKPVDELDNEIKVMAKRVRVAVTKRDLYRTRITEITQDRTMDAKKKKQLLEEYNAKLDKHERNMRYAIETKTGLERVRDIAAIHGDNVSGTQEYNTLAVNEVDKITHDSDDSDDFDKD
jgi:hypothetical protein